MRGNRRAIPMKVSGADVSRNGTSVIVEKALRSIPCGVIHVPQ
jgi:hypothetical protein